MLNVIKSLDLNKTNGENYLSVKIFFNVNNLIYSILSKLTNQAFFEGIYPSSLKLANNNNKRPAIS